MSINIKREKKTDLKTEVQGVFHSCFEDGITLKTEEDEEVVFTFEELFDGFDGEVIKLTIKTTNTEKM